MRPAYNFESKYRVTTLAKEQWTRGPGTPPTVQSDIQMGPERGGGGE